MNRCITAAAALALVAGAAHANLLGNPGFEDDTLFDVNAFDNPGNWVAFFGGPAGTNLESFNFTGTAPLSGAKAMETSISADSGTAYNAFTGQVQFVPGIVGDQEYTYSIWARNDDSTLNGGVEYRIEWIGASGFIGDQFALNTPIGDQLTDEYQQFSLTATAPPDAIAAQVVIAVQSFANDGVNPADVSVAWDDASLVPAPAALAFAPAAGLLALRRRRNG